MSKGVKPKKTIKNEKTIGYSLKLYTYSLITVQKAFYTTKHKLSPIAQATTIA